MKENKRICKNCKSIYKTKGRFANIYKCEYDKISDPDRKIKHRGKACDKYENSAESYYNERNKKNRDRILSYMKTIPNEAITTKKIAELMGVKACTAAFLVNKMMNDKSFYRITSGKYALKDCPELRKKYTRKITTSEYKQRFGDNEKVQIKVNSKFDMSPF